MQVPLGTAKYDLDTPILCIDLDAMEANIAAMARFLAERGKQWRPHQKCHKTPAIAWKQIEAGAIGVTCAKVSEAEVMASAGIHDLLIANTIVGAPKWERVAALCRQAKPIVSCDHFAQLKPLAETCRRRGVTCRVVVEVEIGMNRTGIRPGQDALELAQAADRLSGVDLVGLMGYEGHLLTVPDLEEKRRRIQEAMGVLQHCRELLLKHGLRCDIVTAGGTGSFQITAECPVVTELQAGGGIFADPFYLGPCQVQGLRSALTVLATVVSRPTLDRAVLDCGRKTVNPLVHPPLLKDLPDAEITEIHAEHCMVRLGPNARDLAIGDKLELVVGYSDFTTVLHDHFYGFRGDRLEVIWPIAGRGCLN
ncbi:MAG TPA: DSD1 family PLP-dependent enzyme [Planctomycetaceae bacterium]|nr:DSD1 family PLP-dependent enzyme [Planctomycetaceae bacterium]